jgi:hypothetical protein
LLQAGFRPAGGNEKVTFFADSGEVRPPLVPEPSSKRPVLCQGWREQTMVEAQAPFWINGGGTLELHVAAPGRVRARVWIDGREVDPVDVARTRTLLLRLGAPRWHSVTLEVARLFPTKPPSGLRIVRLLLRPERS